MAENVLFFNFFKNQIKNQISFFFQHQNLTKNLIQKYSSRKTVFLYTNCPVCCVAWGKRNMFPKLFLDVSNLTSLSANNCSISLCPSWFKILAMLHCCCFLFLYFVSFETKIVLVSGGASSFSNKYLCIFCIRF